MGLVILTLLIAAPADFLAHGYLYSDPSKAWICDTIPGNAGRVPQSGLDGPDLVMVADDGAGSTGVWDLCYDDSVEESSLGNAQILINATVPTKVYTNIHWYPFSASSGVARLCVEFVLRCVGEGDPGNTVIQCFDETAVAAKGAQKLVVPELNYGNTGTECVTTVRFFRDGSHANDTMVGDACVTAFQICYQVERTAALAP